MPAAMFSQMEKEGGEPDDWWGNRALLEQFPRAWKVVRRSHTGGPLGVGSLVSKMEGDDRRLMRGLYTVVLTSLWSGSPTVWHSRLWWDFCGYINRLTILCAHLNSEKGVLT